MVKLTPEELEEALKTLTDKVSLLDALIKGAKILWFRCRHSGLMYPSDYASKWGKTYGIGLGTDVVSETLNTRYDLPVVSSREAKRSTDIMHPLEVTKTQVDPMFLPQGENTVESIPAIQDPFLELRKEIIYQKQIKNPLSKVPLYMRELQGVA